MNSLKLGSHIGRFLHHESQQEPHSPGQGSWGAGGGPKRPPSVRPKGQGPAALGGALLRGRGRGVSCPSSTVAMDSVPAALGTREAQLRAGEPWEGSMCHTAPSPSQSCRDARARRQGRRPICAGGCVGQGPCQPWQAQGTSYICSWWLRAARFLLSQARSPGLGKQTPGSQGPAHTVSHHFAPSPHTYPKNG